MALCAAMSRTPDVCRTLPENSGFERWTTHCPPINGGAFGSACRTFIQARQTPLNCFAIPLLAHPNQVRRRIARAEQSVRRSLGELAIVRPTLLDDGVATPHGLVRVVELGSAHV